MDYKWDFVIPSMDSRLSRTYQDMHHGLRHTETFLRHGRYKRPTAKLHSDCHISIRRHLLVGIIVFHQRPSQILLRHSLSPNLSVIYLSMKLTRGLPLCLLGVDAYALPQGGDSKHPACIKINKPTLVSCTNVKPFPSSRLIKQTFQNFPQAPLPPNPTTTYPPIIEDGITFKGFYPIDQLNFHLLPTSKSNVALVQMPLTASPPAPPMVIKNSNIKAFQLKGFGWKSGSFAKGHAMQGKLDIVCQTIDPTTSIVSKDDTLAERRRELLLSLLTSPSEAILGRLRDAICPLHQHTVRRRC